MGRGSAGPEGHGSKSYRSSVICAATDGWVALPTASRHMGSQNVISVATVFCPTAKTAIPAGPVAVILFCVVLQQIGRIAARVTGLAEGDCLTISIEVTVKNGLLALLLITSMFPHDALRSQDAETVAVIEAARDGCTYTVLLFGAVTLILGTISVIQRRSIIGGAG